MVMVVVVQCRDVEGGICARRAGYLRAQRRLGALSVRLGGRYIYCSHRGRTGTRTATRLRRGPRHRDLDGKARSERRWSCLAGDRAPLRADLDLGARRMENTRNPSATASRRSCIWASPHVIAPARQPSVIPRKKSPLKIDKNRSRCALSTAAARALSRRGQR